MSHDFQVVLSGGLGNQLFQISAGLFAAINNDLTVGFVSAPTKFSSFNHKNEIREFVELPIASWPNEAKIFANASFRLKRKAASSLNLASQVLKIDAPKEFGYSSNLKYVAHGWKMMGYYQSFIYYEKVAPNLRSIIKEPILSDWARNLREKILNERLASIHVRRGDYVILAENFGLLGFNYYESAMNEINSRTGKEHFVVFSDDVKAARDLLSKTKYKLTFVEPPQGTPSGESLHLMSFCQDHVIANSSFSWWGAALAQVEGVTVAPLEWMKNKVIIKNLIPSEWIRSSPDWVN